jgi:hypothetical protein
MTQEKSIGGLQRRYEKLAARLATLGPIVQGTITERTITKKDPKNPAAIRTIGPYYQWTFKSNGKTVTVNLSASQVKLFQRAIDTNKKVENLLTQMRELSRQILEASSEGVKRRKLLK